MARFGTCDRTKAEVVLRIGLASFAGFCLSVADIPSVVPPSLSFMLGLLACTLALVVPSLLFSLAGVLPSILMLIITILGAGTMLLCAATVSDGLLVAIFSIYCLFICTLFFGEKYDKTYGNATAYMSLAALVALSYRPLAQVGGMAAVRDLWKEQGVDNPVAVFRNLLICLMWVVACLTLAILVPPIRTARRTIYQAVLPAIFSKLATSFEVQKIDTDDQNMIHTWNSLSGQSVAKMIIFEPRLCRSPSDLLTSGLLVSKLQELLDQTDYLILASMVLPSLTKGDTTEETDPDNTFLTDAASILKACATALSTDNQDDIIASKKQTEESSREEAPMSPSSLLHGQSIRVRDATFAWLEALNHPKPPASFKEGTSSFANVFLTWILAPLVPFVRLAAAFKLPFQPRRWNLRSVMWAFKLSFGFVTLFIMSVYWDGYANFALRSEPDAVGAVYSGWNLLGYAYSWRPTAEGTIKKGAQRLLGTAVGGFLAWLGIIVCRWSYDDDAEINPYGLVAWLTVTTVGIALFARDSGFAAQLGLGYDHGTAGMYTAMTQALIALETYGGQGTVNDLTANRVVATITGVAMAMVLAFIPPFVKGGDPRHARVYNDALNDAFASLLESAVDETKRCKMTDQSRREFFLPIHERRRYAIFLVDDAAKLYALPVFRVDKRLKPLIESMAVTESLLGHLYTAMARSNESDLSSIEQDLKHILSQRGSDEYDGDQEVGRTESVQEDQASVLLSLVRLIHERLGGHSAAVKDLE